MSSKPFNNGCSIPQLKQHYQGEDIPCIFTQGTSTLSLAGLKTKVKLMFKVMVQSPVLRLCYRTSCWKSRNVTTYCSNPRPAEVALSLSQSERCSNSLLLFDITFCSLSFNRFHLIAFFLPHVLSILLSFNVGSYNYNNNGERLKRVTWKLMLMIYC